MLSKITGCNYRDVLKHFTFLMVTYCLAFRTEEEKKSESDIMKKIKGMYKAHRAQKKKDSEKKASLVALNAADLPVIEEQPEEPEDDFDAASHDDDDYEPTPEEIELNDAFDSFALKDLTISVGNESVTSSIAGVLNIRALQSVFIQVFNRYIPFESIADAFYDDTGLPLEEGEDVSVDYDQFRRIHYQLQSRFAEEENIVDAPDSGSRVFGNNSRQGDSQSLSRGSTTGDLKFDLGGIISRQNSESAGSLGSARGSGIMAVRNMNKTVS